jgi:hypothetical protein
MQSLDPIRRADRFPLAFREAREGEQLVAGLVQVISLATRIWPKAGCSSENSTIRSAISGAVRFAKIGFLRLISCNASSPPLS